MAEDNNQKPPEKKPVVPSVSWSDNSPEANEILSKADKFVDAKGAAMQYFDLGPKAQDKEDKKAPPRLALSFDPNLNENIQGVKAKTKGLLPDALIKEISTTNHLIASILRTWANTVSMMGHFKKDRFDIGTVVNIKPDFEREMTPEQIAKVQERIDKFKTLLV